MRSVGRNWVLGHGRLFTVVATVGVSMLLAACGSTSDSEGGSTESGTNAEANSPAAMEAKKVIEMADGKLVYSAVEIPSSASDIVPYGRWRGPTSAPAHESGKRVEVIVCTKQAAACVDGATGVQQAAAELGWKSGDVIDGGGTPQAFGSAFDTAISRKPDAIVMVAVPTVAVGDSLVKAKQAGIKTVAIGDTEPTSGVRADAYVPFPMPLMSAVLAFHDIATTNAEAKTILMEDRGFPVLIQSADAYKKVLSTCSTCESWSRSWQLTDALDPTKINSIIGGALSSHPDATALNLPYSEGLPAVVQAVQSAGKELAIYVKDGDTVGLKGIADGGVTANAGGSTTWAGWAATDQVVRGLAKAPYLEPTETGLGVALFTKGNVPPDGDIDQWSGLIDYQAEYSKIWK